MAKDKASAAQLDFTNVKDGGNFNKKRQAPGDYPAKVTKVQDATKKDDKSVKMWLFTIQVGSGAYPYYCVHAENQLWKIRNIFIAAGINVPKKRLSVDPNKVVGRDIAVTLEDEEYEGKMQSVIASVFPRSELDGDAVPSDDEDEAEPEEDEEVEEAPKAKKKKAKEADPEPEPESKKKKDKKAKSVEAPPVAEKGKKKKAKAVDAVADSELEELEIEDI